MYLLGKEKHYLTNELIFNDEFKKQAGLLFDILQLSRIPEYRNDKDVIFEIQRGIGAFIKRREKFLKIAIKEAKESDVKVWNNDMNVFANNRLIRIARTIMDGIVWRNIGYRRVWATVLSHNKRNRLNDDFEKLLDTANYFSKHYISIVSDLTETVRIGDLLFINKKGFPLITEAKNGKNGKLELYNFLNINLNKAQTKQKNKLINTQDIINLGEIETINANIEDNNNIVPFRYFKQVEQGISEASESGFCTLRLNKYTSVRIIDSANIGVIRDDNKLRAISGKAKNLVSNKKGDKILPISNLDSFYFKDTIFLKGFPPYSIFPFSDNTCMKLMTGELQIISYINVSGICGI